MERISLVCVDKMEEVQPGGCREDGKVVDITEQVFKHLQDNPMPGFQVTMMSKANAAAIVKQMQIDILTQIFEKKFECKKETVEKFQKWLGEQTRMVDGCIEFLYCPCSMGEVIFASNSLTGSRIELTEY